MNKCIRIIINSNIAIFSSIARTACDVKQFYIMNLDFQIDREPFSRIRLTPVIISQSNQRKRPITPI